MITFHEVLTPLKAKAFPELAKTFERLRKFAMKHNFPVVFVGSQRQPKSTGDFILTIPRDPDSGTGRIRLRLIKTRTVLGSKLFYDPNSLKLKLRKNHHGQTP